MGAGHRAGESRRRTGGAALSILSAGRRAAADRGVRIPVGAPASWAPARALVLAGAAGALALVLPLVPVPATAQDALVAHCPSLPLESDRWHCAALAQAAAVAQARSGLAAAGGNPLPGSASTLGMRLPGRPRYAAQLRVSGGRVTLPSASAQYAQSLSSGTGSLRTTTFLTSIDADGAVGVFDGLAPGPTVGGVGSLDLLASLGYMPGPGHGFDGGAWTGAAGARLGIVRESFTLPGVTLSGAYRRLGGAAYGHGSLAPGQTYLGSVALSGTSDVSLRLVAGKRLFVLGTTVGIGLDRFSSDVTVARSCPIGALCTPEFGFDFTGPLRQTRANAFGALTWTSLVFTGTAELGWQRGGSPAATTPVTGFEGQVRSRGLFGSLAFRLTI